MRKIITFVFIGFLGLALFSSCEEDDQSSPATLDTTKTATITGIVEAQLDLMNDTTETTLEAAPNGTKLIFTVDADDYVLNPDEGINYNTLIYEVEVTNGAYTIEVPAVEKGVDITITPVDFAYNQKQIDFDAELDDFVYTDEQRKVYTADEITVTVLPGQTKIVDFTYGTGGATK